MIGAQVLLMGDPRLRKVAEAVGDPADPDLAAPRAQLVATLEEFRRTHGFGRAIAAPQIGVARRFIALDLGEGAFVIHDPQITWRSDATFTLWDDCLSFPDLMVKVSRNESVTVEFTDEAGKRVTWDHLDRSLSELLQHEIDHLDGVLAVDRVVEPGALVLREVYERLRDDFDAQVDYRIEPTV